MRHILAEKHTWISADCNQSQKVSLLSLCLLDADCNLYCCHGWQRQFLACENNLPHASTRMTLTRVMMLTYSWTWRAIGWLFSGLFSSQISCRNSTRWKSCSLLSSSQLDRFHPNNTFRCGGGCRNDKTGDAAAWRTRSPNITRGVEGHVLKTDYFVEISVVKVKFVVNLLSKTIVTRIFSCV